MTPTSEGDKSYCELDAIPDIAATVKVGETIDWYDSPSGGILLLAGSLNYSPSDAGTYYALARDITTNCVSSTRTPVTVRMNTLPNASLVSSDTDNIFCEGTPLTFTAGGGVNYNFRIDEISVQNDVLTEYKTTLLTDGQVVDVIVTSEFGCASTSDGITNVVNSVPVANAGSGGSECDLDFILKAQASMGLGTWAVTSGPGTVLFLPDNNTPGATASVSAYGEYIFTWTEINNDCSSSSDINVSFFQQAVADAGIGGNNCGLEFSLNANPSAGLGTWAQVLGPGTSVFTPNTNAPNAEVAVSEFGSYSFAWTEINGNCSDVSTVNINFIERPPANGGIGGNECDLDFQLNAVQDLGNAGIWSKLSGPGAAIFSPDATNPNALVIVDQPGIYEFSWLEINSTCQSTDVINVTFNEVPQISAGPDTIICEGTSVQLQAVNDPGTVLWDNISLLSDPSIANPIATPEITTVFKVHITSEFGCENSDELIVEVRKNPSAYAGPDQVLNYVFNTNLDAQVPEQNESGYWKLIHGSGIISDTNDVNTSIMGLSIGENLFEWTVSNQVCLPSKDTVTINIDDFIIPSLITPNMDGKNDFFNLRGLETLGRTELIIFDRRGALVYKNDNYDNSWDGVDYNKDPLLDDTYFYVIKSANGKSFSGYIVIRR